MRAHLGVEALAADLPGQGRSQINSRADEAAWLDALLAKSAGPIVLVAHSYASATAVELATRYPEKISALILISPYFMGDRPPFLLRHPFLAKPVLHLAAARQLRSMGQDAEHLRRPGAIRRLAEHLRQVGKENDRRKLRHQLAMLVENRVTPVMFVNGGKDRPQWPIPAGAKQVIIADAGHHPQLTHASQLAQLIRDAMASQ